MLCPRAKERKSIVFASHPFVTVNYICTQKNGMAVKLDEILKIYGHGKQWHENMFHKTCDSDVTHMACNVRVGHQIRYHIDVGMCAAELFCSLHWHISLCLATDLFFVGTVHTMMLHILDDSICCRVLLCARSKTLFHFCQPQHEEWGKSKLKCHWEHANLILHTDIGQFQLNISIIMLTFAFVAFIMLAFWQLRCKSHWIRFCRLAKWFFIFLFFIPTWWLLRTKVLNQFAHKDLPHTVYATNLCCLSTPCVYWRLSVMNPVSLLVKKHTTRQNRLLSDTLSIFLTQHQFKWPTATVHAPYFYFEYIKI